MKMSGTGVEMMAVCVVCDSLLWWDEDTGEWYCAPCQDVRSINLWAGDAGGT